MTLFEILTCLVLVGTSAFLSAAEIALFSLSRFQLRSLKERFRSAHRRIKRLLGDPTGLLLTVLVINEVVNVSLSAFIAEFVARSWAETGSEGGTFQRVVSGLFPNAPDWTLQILGGILISWPIVLILCEITPKVIAARASQLVATLSCGPLAAAYDAFKPVRWLLTGLLSLLSRRLGREGGDSAGHALREQVLKEEEFLSMLEEGHKEGDIQESEMELIRNVFELDDTTVAEIMVPVEKVLTLPLNTPIRSAMNTMKTHRFSRIPIAGAGRRQIAGILYSKDLLLERLDPDPTALTGSVAGLMRKPMMVPPTLRLNGLFLRMKKQKMHMAIVENSNGDALGVVTMNDVLEALFDDLIPDEEEELSS